MELLKQIKDALLLFFSDVEDSDEPIYDPVHFAALIVISLVVMGALFWLLWTLLVFGGGIFNKIVPAFQVLFTKKTLKDFGWVGYPYELGIFEGFIGNTVALILTMSLMAGVWWVFKEPETGEEKHGSQDKSKTTTQ